MREVLPFLLEYGYAVLFGVVLAEQAGVPIPSLPVLLGVGALAGLGRMSVWPAILLALIASLISDSLWYWLGRRRGGSMLRLLCAISLEPDSCVGSTKSLFSKLGSGSLLVAKFVPGLSTAAPPMAGVNRMPFLQFLIGDGLGAVLWAGAYLTLGFLFHHQIELVAERTTAYGVRAGAVVAIGLVLYIAYKYWQRERFLHSLRVARITPAEAWNLLNNGAPVAVVDLRHATELSEGTLPGAVWFDRETLEGRHLEIPRDRDVILYCS
jgi:membrane protein DedA with SNARE-associated domain